MILIDWKIIPSDSGVYIWKGVNGQILYIGKAKNLKNRMKQYFKDDLPPKNKLLMKNIVDFDYQVCASELDALLLEETLINEYEPKFNIKIKSAKRYPYIELVKDNIVELKISRTLKFKKNSKFYGPYPDGFSAKKIIGILSSALPVDKCLAPNSGKPCLNFEMDRCMGQCIGKIPEHKKEFAINQIEDFFKGKTEYVEKKINSRIIKNNKLLNFEESKLLVEQLHLINKLKDQRSNTFKDTKHRDIINLYLKDDIVSISIMFVRFGSINLTTNFISKELNYNLKDILESFVNRYYKKNMIPDEVILPFEIKLFDETIKYSVPSSGKKYELIKLVEKNSHEMYLTNVDSFLKKIKGYEETLKFIKDNISTKNINTIEMVDISSTMGSQQVGAIIRFKNGEPNKTNYRKFNIKTLNIMDDYLATEEVAKRHFKNLLEKNNLPDLFIVDGKHQLTNVNKVLNSLKIFDVVLIGLIKDENHKTNSIITSEGNIILLDKKTEMYLFLSRLQEEVHRFVINFHRQKREREIIESKLDDYLFLTEQDKKNLFKEFKSIRKILTANESELRKVLSESKVQKFMKEK